MACAVLDNARTPAAKRSYNLGRRWPQCLAGHGGGSSRDWPRSSSSVWRTWSSLPSEVPSSWGWAPLGGPCNSSRSPHPSACSSSLPRRGSKRAGSPCHHYRTHRRFADSSRAEALAGRPALTRRAPGVIDVSHPGSGVLVNTLAEMLPISAAARAANAPGSCERIPVSPQEEGLGVR